MSALDTIKNAKKWQAEQLARNAQTTELLKWRALRQASAEILLYAMPLATASAIYDGGNIDLPLCYIGLMFIALIQPTKKNISKESSVGWRNIVIFLMSMRFTPWVIAGYWALDLVGKIGSGEFSFSVHYTIVSLICAGLSGWAWYKLVFGKKTQALKAATAVYD